MAVQRALSQIIAVPEPPKGAPADAGHRPVAYRLLGGYNGGFDPDAPHCASWSFGDRTPTADCVGFVLWASGVDREQPGYNGSRDVWLNCASLLDDANGTNLPAGTAPRRYCRPLAEHEPPRPGDWCLTRDHISMVVRVTGEPGREELLVVDCSPRHGRDAAINTGLPWSDACEVVRPLVYA